MDNIITKVQKTEEELCQIIATSVTDIVRDSLNPTFRQTYFDTIQVTNSSDAQKLLENRLFNLLDVNKLCENKNTKNDIISVEDYIASKILRLSDAINTHRYSEMILLIRYILKIDSKLDEPITKN